MIGTAINSLRAWKAVWDVIFSDKPEHQRQREELNYEWECMKQRAREELQEFDDVRTGRKAVPPEQPVIRNPFRIALWILLSVQNAFWYKKRR